MLDNDGQARLQPVCTSSLPALLKISFLKECNERPIKTSQLSGFPQELLWEQEERGFLVWTAYSHLASLPPPVCWSSAPGTYAKWNLHSFCPEKLALWSNWYASIFFLLIIFRPPCGSHSMTDGKWNGRVSFPFWLPIDSHNYKKVRINWHKWKWFVPSFRLR